MKTASAPAPSAGRPGAPGRSDAAAPAHVHPIYARLLRVLLQQAGADGDRVLQAAGIDPARLMTDDRRLGVASVVRAVEAALAATGRPWLGLDLGAQAPVSAHGSVGYAAVTARDGRAALRALARFGALRSDAFEWRFEEPAGPGGPGHLRLVEHAPLGAARPFIVDAVVAAALRVLEAAIGPLPAGVQVALPLPEPPWSAQYRRFGDCRVTFGAPALTVSADASALARPCLGADARAHEAACRACEEAMAELGGHALAPRVAALIGAGGAAPPGLAQVAARCGVSPRTLMRRLRAEGTRYQALVDAQRRERARWLLQHTARPIEAIAEELGYADTSNFSRTVRRWFGATPKAVRAAASDGG